jgi:hypothetical protein
MRVHARHHPERENLTLDRIDFEKLKVQAQQERADFLRRYGTATTGAVGSTLRAHHVIAVVAILVISFGVKMFFLSAPTAEADMRPVPSASMGILQMHRDTDMKQLPLQKMYDKTFIFTE